MKLLKQIGETLLISKSFIMDNLNIVGEGIDDITYTSIYVRNEYTNEVTITFIDNTWGGIESNEWDKLNPILNQLSLDYPDFEDYLINTTTNKLILMFNSNIEIDLIITL